MDSDLLVEKIDDGELLIRQLVRAEFDVEIAFWAKGRDEDLWRLYIVSRRVRINGVKESYRAIHMAMEKIPGCSVLLSEITLLSDTDGVVKDAVAVRDKHASNKPIHIHSTRLGPVSEWWIYPRRLPLKVRQDPDGQWQVLISEPDHVWLTCDSEDEARAIAAAPVLEYEALAHLKSGEGFAKELERTAEALAKHRMSFGYRFFTQFAGEARK